MWVPKAGIVGVKAGYWCIKGNYIFRSFLSPSARVVIFGFCTQEFRYKKLTGFLVDILHLSYVVIHEMEPAL